MDKEQLNKLRELIKKDMKAEMLETIFVQTGGRPENPLIAEICAEIANKWVPLTVEPERQKTNPIYGIMMRPVSTTQEENEEVMQSSPYSVKKDYMKEYRLHLGGMQIVAECAKIYVLNNYEKVKSWTDLNVVIEDNSDKSTEYYNHKDKDVFPSNGKTIADFVIRRNERNKKRHNPIVTLTDCVLDTSDGDFSLTINGNDHLWISDDSIVVIADYIEKQLETIPF
jgi:hypothetical protein